MRIHEALSLNCLYEKDPTAQDRSVLIIKDSLMVFSYKLFKKS